MALSDDLRALDGAPYGAIMADPPWHFVSYDKKASIPHRRKVQPYATMTRAELQGLPVAEIASANCILFLWVIDTHLDQAMELGRAWGFKYKTRAFEWVKVVKAYDRIGELIDGDMPIGMGFWTRKQTESCLLFTRGHPKRLNADVRQVMIDQRRDHSQKPDQVYPRIERLVKGPYLELFARRWRPGWDAVGEELV